MVVEYLPAVQSALVLLDAATIQHVVEGAGGDDELLHAAGGRQWRRSPAGATSLRKKEAQPAKSSMTNAEAVYLRSSALITFFTVQLAGEPRSGGGRGLSLPYYLGNVELHHLHMQARQHR